MSSPTAEVAAPAPLVKEEDSIVADTSMPDAIAHGTPKLSAEVGLTKKDLDTMSSILARITNHKDEESVFRWD